MMKNRIVKPNVIRLITLIICMSCTLAYMTCSSEPRPPKYHLIEKCYRSSHSIAARGNFTSLNSCKRLGMQKKALALNFSPQNGSVEYTCDVLKCAEVEGGLSLNKDSRYDYYTIYAKPLPNINSTCVPSTGMFLILPNKLNYSQAKAQCGNVSAMLADITSEQRTDALAQALITAGVDQAYVGMKRNDYSSFTTDNGDRLNCFTYRAWAPGHPQRHNNAFCVLLTKHRTWKTVRCRDKYQALCELMPGGPYKKGSIFTSENKISTDKLTDNLHN